MEKIEIPKCSVCGKNATEIPPYTTALIVVKKCGVCGQILCDKCICPEHPNPEQHIWVCITEPKTRTA